MTRRCICFGGDNPACPVDHEREQARLDDHRDRLLADPDWVKDRLGDTPALTFTSGYVLDGRRIFDENYSGRATLLALGTGGDEALLAAARFIRAGLVELATQEAAEAARDRRDGGA